MTTTPFNWREILKFIITVLTAIAGALGMQSCL
jgi:hypothetical protein